MSEKRRRRAATLLLAAALLLTAPLQAAGWTAPEAPGLLERAWGWLVERLAGAIPAASSPRPAAEGVQVPAPPGGEKPGGETLPGPGPDDGGAIDPNG